MRAVLRKGFVAFGLVIAVLAVLLSVVPGGGAGVRVVAAGDGDAVIGAPESVTATTTTEVETTTVPVSATVPVATTTEVETTTVPVSATGEPTTTTTATPDRGCQEDEECWNSCTMGVDGRFDPSDPRFNVPGPCNLFALLPYGRRFSVQVEPTGDVCGAPGPWVARWALVSVSVVESGGAVVYQATGTGCVDADSPVSGSGWVADLFRQAGSHA